MKSLICTFLPIFLAVAAAPAQPRPPGKTGQARHKRIEYGTASYYANKFQGRPTASGERYDKNKMTCAHNSLPMGTWIKVTNIKNKRSVIVRVTDRLHHSNKRLVDLSMIAAARLGYLRKGLTRVKVEVLAKKHPDN
ncbi:MAG: septal ring lytic transglycosylase RlpA family protein [Bacteroidota bacterium]